MQQHGSNRIFWEKIKDFLRTKIIFFKDFNYFNYSRTFQGYPTIFQF